MHHNVRELLSRAAAALDPQNPLTGLRPHLDAQIAKSLRLVIEMGVDVWDYDKHGEFAKERNLAEV